MAALSDRELIDQLLGELDVAETEWSYYKEKLEMLEAREAKLKVLIKEWLDLTLPSLLELRNQLEK